MLQGGPGFPTLLPLVYQYIVTGNYDPHDIHVDDVADYQVQSLLSEVKRKCLFWLIYNKYYIFMHRRLTVYRMMKP